MATPNIPGVTNVLTARSPTWRAPRGGNQLRTIAVDWTACPPSLRLDALRRFWARQGVGGRFAFTSSPDQTWIRWEQVQAFRISHLTSRGEFSMTRSVATSSELAGCLAVSVVDRGVCVHRAGVTISSYRAGQVFVEDLGGLSELTFADDAHVTTVLLSYRELALPTETVRQAIPVIADSPIYPLLRAHMHGLWAVASALDNARGVQALVAATRELVRSAIATSGSHADPLATSGHVALKTQIIRYVERRLGDPSLSPEATARAHFISLRQLHKLWADDELTFQRWVVSQRLEGARCELAGSSSTAGVAVVAERWGFLDPTHFSRAVPRGVRNVSSGMATGV